MRTLALLLALAPAAALAAPLDDDPGIAPPDSAPAPAAAADYHHRLVDLQRRVDELKAHVFIDRVKIDRLRRIVLDHGDDGIPRVTIVRRVAMEPIYRLVEADFQLDGMALPTRPPASAQPVFDGVLEPRAHTLQVKLVFQGEGGPFKYVEGYRFTVEGSHTFTAAEGRRTRIEVLGTERGDPVTTPMERRPAVEFKETIERD